MDPWQPLLHAGIVDDPWLDGQERLSLAPVVVTRAEAGRLAEAACAVAMMLDEAVQATAGDDGVLLELGLDQSLIDIARLDAPRWLGLVRADVFAVADGGPPQVCEINSDTPTGLAECIELGRLAAASHLDLADPSARLRERWLGMVRACIRPGVRRPVVGIIDPTEVTDDLCHIRQLTRWLEEAGMRVVRGAPFNLHACTGRRVGLFTVPCDVLLRHYKTDLWAQRTKLWLHERLPEDDAPLSRELALIADSMAAGTVGVMNPWGSAIAQNKRTMALPWERPHLFHPQTLEAVRRSLPETRFLESLPRHSLIADRHAWVLKSDYGCEGAEVLVGRDAEAALWRECVSEAAPGRWIVQRAIAPKRDADGRQANHGVYLVGGTPSGLYTRLSHAATGVGAVSHPTLVGA
jgi:glutathionylspermidine synthase